MGEVADRLLVQIRVSPRLLPLSVASSKCRYPSSSAKPRFPAPIQRPSACDEKLLCSQKEVVGQVRRESQSPRRETRSGYRGLHSQTPRGCISRLATSSFVADRAGGGIRHLRVKKPLRRVSTKRTLGCTPWKAARFDLTFVIPSLQAAEQWRTTARSARPKGRIGLHFDDEFEFYGGA